MPRPPLPPYPERYLQAWRFDDPAGLLNGGQGALATLNLHQRESWSGYALEMSGADQELFALPLKSPEDHPNLTLDNGAVRFYFAPDWSSAGLGEGPGEETRLLEFGAWSAQSQEALGWLGLDATGSTLRLLLQGDGGPVEILRAPLQWAAGDWHQVALVWSGRESVVLYLDGRSEAVGSGWDLNILNQLNGIAGFCLGSDVEGNRLAQGQFEEFYTFSHACTAEEMARNWQAQEKRAALGPITEEEEQNFRLEAAALRKVETPGAPVGAAMMTSPACGLWLSIAPSGTDTVELTLHNTTPGTPYRILSRQSLSSGSWIDETTTSGASGQNETQITVQMGVRPTLFFQAVEMGPNRIQTENAITGTTDWQLTDPAGGGWPSIDTDTTPEIQGFASATSVNAGETLTFYVDVRNGDPTFTIDFYRMGWYGGLGARWMGTSGDLDGEKQPVPGMGTDGLIDCLLPAPANPNGPWQPSYSLTVPSDWVSGVYLAKMTTSASGKQSYIHFVVRDDCRSSDFLFQTSVTTYQAYNPWGGNSLYPYPCNQAMPPCNQASRVSFNRPYAAPINPNFAFATGAGEFLATINSEPYLGWEYHLLRWMERQGYDVSYSTSIDTHRPWPAHKSIKAFLSVGHDEYWSADMRSNVETARDQGVNLAFLAANVCFWRLTFDPSSDERIFTVSKGWILCDPNNPNSGGPECDPCFINAPYDPNRPSSEAPYNASFADLWRGCNLDNPEISMIGVQYVFNSVDGSIVIPSPIPDHWFFDHTSGLFNPSQTLPGLLGYEIDGYEDNCPNYAAPLSISSTLVTLGHSPWVAQVMLCDQPLIKSGHSDMVIYTAASGAQVFATGSMQWNWGLDAFAFGAGFPWGIFPPGQYALSRVQQAAQQMTHNVLRSFSGAARAPVTFQWADTTTAGDWSAVYRPDFYKMANWTPDSLPSYATSVTVQGGTLEEWPSQSGDPRALLEPGSATERIASAWTTTDTQNSSFMLDINLDGNPHAVAVYCVDWLSAGTLQRMEVFDSSDLSFSNPLDTRELLMPPNGVYFVWNLTGHKVIRVTKLSAMAGDKAMVSGLFFGD